MFIPEKCMIVEALTPAADAAGRASGFVSLKNVSRAWIVVHVDQGNAATILLSPLQALTVAGGSSKPLATAVPIWADQDCAASDALARQADAVNFTTSAAVKHKLVVFAIDPAKLDRAGAFDCIGLTTGASNAANITEATFYLEMAYASATPPSVVVD